jgi:hypothetical protein
MSCTRVVLLALLLPACGVPPDAPPPAPATEEPTMAAAASPSTIGAAEPGISDGWVRFGGMVTVTAGDQVVLRDDQGRTLRTARGDVRTSGSNVYLRIGGHAALSGGADAGAGGPPSPTPPLSPAPCTTSAECGGGCTSCVGLVRVCCNDGSIVAPCFSVSDCP